MSPYDRVPVPAVPARTAVVAAEGALEDGTYWAAAAVPGPETESVELTLVQAFFADACVEQFGAAGCDGDVGVLDEPSRSVTVRAPDVGEITVVDAERRNFAVPADEWLVLLGGGAPSADAPEGFGYAPYPYLVVVVGGEVAVVRQIWLP